MVAAEDGLLIDNSPRGRNSATLSLGRGCIAVLNSMLERPVRVVPPHVLAQPAQTAGGGTGRKTDQAAGDPGQLSVGGTRKKSDRGWILAKPQVNPSPGSESASLPSAPGLATRDSLSSDPFAGVVLQQGTPTNSASDGAVAVALREALSARKKSGQD